MIMLILSVNPNLNLTPQEKEILQLWEETIKEWRELTKPFSIPRAEEDDNNPNYVQNACSANCGRGSCSISCDGAAVCGCTSYGEPVCMCIDNKYGYNEPLTISSMVEDLSQKPYVGFYTIYDISGRVVFSGNLNGNLPSLKKGVYFLKDKSGKVSRVVVR